MNVIEVSDLEYRYGEFTAVDGVDFTVREGEIFALLGTNGAGKTTTLEVIEGFRAPSDGRVRVLSGEPAAKRTEMGVMMQSSGLIGELSVAETLALWGGLRHRPDSADALMSLVDLAGRRDVAVDKLSGGERRRLDFALAIWGRPPLLILDEPTTGLDPESRDRLWQTVRALRDNGSTILLTTHYLDEAQSLADHVAIMHQGRIQVSGTLSDVLAGAPSRITATLPAGSPALPAFSGSSTVDDHKLVVETREVQGDMYALLRWAESHGLRLPDLTAQQASLQEIFLAIGKGA